MKVESIKHNNTPHTSFKALKVARIQSLNDNISDTFIYSIEKNKDNEFCAKLLNNLLTSDNKRLPIQANSIKNFIKNAFGSITYTDEAVLAVKDNKPFGLLTAMTYEKDTLAHLAYLATWKNQNFQKVKNGGSMLINHLFQKFKDNREINLTPAFNSDLFYFKFGFDYENKYDVAQMNITKNEISQQLEKLTNRFRYQKLSNETSVNLEDIIDLN